MKTIASAKSDYNSSVLPGQLGEIVSYDGTKTYKLIQVEDLDLAANDVVEYSDVTGMEVTKDVSGGSSIGRGFAGVATATVTHGNYGYVQIKGLASCKVAAGVAVAAGSRVKTGTADGCVTAYAATTGSEDYSFGTAVGAATATTSVAGTVAVMIDL